MSPDQIATILNYTKLFRNIDDSVLANLASKIELVTFQVGDTIITQNEVGRTAYVVVSGKVDVYIDNMIMAHFDQYQIFGEFSMMEGSAYTASAKARTEATLLKITADTFFSEFDQNKEFARAMLCALTRRLKRHLIV